MNDDMWRVLGEFYGAHRFCGGMSQERREQRIILTCACGERVEVDGPPPRAERNDVRLLAGRVVARARRGQVILGLGAIETYVGAAQRQMARVAEAAGRDTPEVFTELEFYFNCWAKVAKLMELVTEGGEFPTAQKTLESHTDSLKPYCDRRNDYEHYDDRLRGHADLKKTPMKNPGDLGNLWGTQHSFGGRTVEVSLTSLRLLEGIVSEFMRAVEEDAKRAATGLTE